MLTLIDASCLIHSLYFRAEKAKSTRALKQQMIGLILPAIQKGYSPVLVFDKKDSQKKYWRDHFIEQLGDLHYDLFSEAHPNKNYKEKVTSKPKNKELLNELRQIALDLTGVIPSLIYTEMEADDLIGLICKYKPTELKVDIFTGDRDLAGLVNDSASIRWINMMSNNRYVIETESAVLEFFQKKISRKINKVSEVYLYKSLKGDTSDNLPSNCRIELIDLINHPANNDQKATEYVQDFLKKIC
jgi:5'-3' exonuclease